jgi:hypothetical protein
MKPDDALKTWTALNTFLRTCSEKEVWDLLEREKAGARRKVYLLRIHEAGNRRRNPRERAELMALVVQ